MFIRRRKSDTGSGPYARVAGGKYETNLERWTCYRVMNPFRAGSNSMMPEPEGYLSNIEAIYYVQAECEPKTSDIILEQAANERSNREVFRVDRAIPYRMGSEIIYYAIFVTRIDPVV